MRYFHTIRNKLSVPVTVVTIFFYSMYNKTIIFFITYLGKGYQPQPSASADSPYLHLDYSGYHKSLLIPITVYKMAVLKKIM